IFYKPQVGVTADFIPFYDNGKFHLFYLKDFRDIEKYGEGTPWYQIATDDFIHFDDLGEAIPRGKADEQDLFIFTGSVIKAEGCYHIFYTAHNHHMAEKGIPVQAIAHAVSDDLVHWEKKPEDMFYISPDKYEVNDFRDPFVFYNEEKGMYSMLLVSRRKDSGYPAGFTAEYRSKDLKTWTDCGPFWEPHQYHTHECPDLFRIGDWWYLVYSEYSDRRLTRYVMSRSLEGPWLIPDDDAFDGTGFYAAKTASNGKERYIFGWIATKWNEEDHGGWMWGGNLGVHQLVQNPDGTLSCKIPETLKALGTKKEEISSPVKVSCMDGKAQAHLFDDDGKAYRLDAKIMFDEKVRQFGISFSGSAEDKRGYKYEFFPKRGKVDFACISPLETGRDMERPIELTPGTPVNISLIVDGSICVLYVNDRVALSSRLYHPAGHDISFFAVGGSAEMTEATLTEL
ncbi:MAG: GH32 C-terminal domain-containing protein, partial [Eubacteriales bacterium]